MARYAITIETERDPVLPELDAYLVLRNAEARPEDPPVARRYLTSRSDGPDEWLAEHVLDALVVVLSSEVH